MWSCWSISVSNWFQNLNQSKAVPSNLEINNFGSFAFESSFFFPSFFSNCFLISILISSSCFSCSNFLRNSTSCSWSSLRLDFASSLSSNSWIALSKLDITASNYDILSSSGCAYASISLASSFLSVMISCTFIFQVL